MSLYLHSLSQPVEQAYGGGDSLHVRKLQEFCHTTITNFQLLQTDFNSLRLRAAEINNINTKLIQFVNWLAVTNPQILDEFQTTASAFDKLSPRNGGDEEQPHASPKSV